MAADHELSEEDLKQTCPYCKHDMSDQKLWKSCFCGSIHYKHATCNCGKDLSIKVEFEGSGHDMWSGAPSWMFNEEVKETPVKKLDDVIDQEALEERRSDSNDSGHKRRKED